MQRAADVGPKIRRLQAVGVTTLRAIAAGTQCPRHSDGSRRHVVSCAGYATSSAAGVTAAPSDLRFFLVRRLWALWQLVRR